MFDFFKKDKSKSGDDQQRDAKGVREAVLQLIKEELQQLDGGEGNAIATMQLYVSAAAEERFVYEAALYSGHPGRLEEEVQRIADNFALDLPLNWKLELVFVEELPFGTIRRDGLKAGLSFNAAVITAVTGKEPYQAKILILKGQAAQDEYVLKPEGKRINIGRGTNIQASDGSFRINEISFPEDTANENNKYVSRQHAHIEWDNESAVFKFYADAGGVPPGNKTKMRSAKDESIYKINSTQIGYPLNDGDQVILGDAVVLGFTLHTV